MSVESSHKDVDGNFKKKWKEGEHFSLFTNIMEACRPCLVRRNWDELECNL